MSKIVPGSNKTAIAILAFAVLSGAVAARQTHTGKANAEKRKWGNTPLAVYEVRMSQDEHYPAISWSKDDPFVQASCDRSGNMYVWKGMLGLFAMTRDGVISFSKAKITDVPHPVLTQLSADIAISDAGIVYRATGVADDDIKKDTMVITNEQGQNRLVPTQEVLRSREYIVRFDKDGHYDGAIADLPFSVYGVAAFNSGNLLVQGMDERRIPRIALLDPRGRLLLYLHLPKDISATQDLAPTCDSCPANDVEQLLLSSHFTPWQRSLLFFRVNGSARIYEIAETGEIRAIAVKAPAGYTMNDVIPSDRNWLVSFFKPDADVRFLFEVNPESGELLREYRITEALETISCFMGGEFWGLRRNINEGTLTVIRGSAQPYQHR